MHKHTLRNTFTVAVMAVVTLQFALASYLGASPARAAQRPLPETVPASEDHDHDSPTLPDVDLRRDPVTGEINGLRDRKTARLDSSAAVAALRATMPGQPDGLRVDLLPTGLAKQVLNFGGMLAEPMPGTPDEVAREFLAHNAALFGLDAADAAGLKVAMKDVDSASGVTFLKYEQVVNGVRVFNSEISVAVSPKGEVAIVTAGQLVQGAAVSAPALSKEEAIVRAFAHCGAEITADRLDASSEKRADGLAKFANPLGAGRADVLAEPSLVNVRGEARLAFHVYVDKGPSEWYETLVDADSGELVYRGSLYAHNRGTVFTQHPVAGPRTLEPFTVDTAKFPNVSAGDIWVNDRFSTGNNVDAYIDRDANNLPDPVSTATLSDGRAFSTADGNFTFPFKPNKDPRKFAAASAANLFYLNNVMHDRMYDLGFTETARNFQLANYGRGGAQNDRVLAETQDGSGTDNANFATPPDGQSPRMQMFLFTRFTGSPADDRDSSMDADVVFHEYGHGVSNRLIGNGSGLTGIQSRAMGEGWSDYWALSAFGDGVMGEFVTGNSASGIRRTPYDGRTTFPNGDYAMLGTPVHQPHLDGEVWCQTLVDLRNQLGAAVTDRLVLTGMKMTPVSPSMLNARDGIVAADIVLNGGGNLCAIWTVFARHGMGVSALGNDGITHVAAYDVRRDHCAHTPADNAQFYTTDGAGGIAPLMGYTDWRSSWTIVVPGDFNGDGITDLLFYDPAANTGEFYSTDGNGRIWRLATHTDWNSTWDMIIPGNFNGDAFTDLLFYDREAGIGSFWTTDGAGGIAPLQEHTGWRGSWDLIVPGEFGGDGHTDLLFYDRAAGTGEFYVSDGTGVIWPMSTHDDWNATWDLIVPGSFGGGSHTDLLFYDREAGIGSFWMTDGQGGIGLLVEYFDWRGSWNMIIPGNFGADGHTDLLFYDRAAGTGEFYTTDGWGLSGLLKTHFDWRSTWYLIVPGSFGGDSREDLLFYQR
jgi:hypothetical protein